MTIASWSSSLSSSPKLLHATSLLSPDMAFMWDTPSVESLRRLLSLTTTTAPRPPRPTVISFVLLMHTWCIPVNISCWTCIVRHWWTLLWSRQQTQWQWWRGPGAGPRRMFQIGVIYFFLVMACYKHDILACIPSFTIIKREIQAGCSLILLRLCSIFQWNSIQKGFFFTRWMRCIVSF